VAACLALPLAMTGTIISPVGAEGAVRVIGVGPGQPYADLASALAEAGDGDRVEVHGGRHAGPLVIDKAIDLVGLDRPLIDGGGQGTVVTLRAAGARVAGFHIQGSGARSDHEDAGILAEARAIIEDNEFDDVLYGISLKQAPDSLIRGNRVQGRDVHIARRGDGIRIWESHGTHILDNRVSGARDVVIWYSERLLIQGNRVRDGRYGLHYMYSHDSRIEDNRFDRNAVGIFMMYSRDLSIARNVLTGNHGPSGYGLALKDCDDILVEDNVMAGNRVGLYLDNTPTSRDSHNRIAGNAFAYNDQGLLLLPTTARNSFEANAFVENFEQVALSSRGTAMGNDWSSGGRGNYWSDYAGYDADGDGLGDLPYETASLFHDLLERQPALRLFSLSPAHGMLDLAARAFPVFRPPTILEDTRPLTAPPPPPLLPPASDGGPLAAFSALLAAGALSLVVWARSMDPLGARLLNFPVLPQRSKA
jgi:nitrous oxidase accessory protein